MFANGAVPRSKIEQRILTKKGPKFFIDFWILARNDIWPFEEHFTEHGYEQIERYLEFDMSNYYFARRREASP